MLTNSLLYVTREQSTETHGTESRRLRQRSRGPESFPKGMHGTIGPAIADRSEGGTKNKNPNFVNFSKEFGLRSVKNGRSISKRAPGPDYRPDSLILRSESDISIFSH